MPLWPENEPFLSVAKRKRRTKLGRSRCRQFSSHFTANARCHDSHHFRSSYVTPSSFCPHRWRSGCLRRFALCRRESGEARGLRVRVTGPAGGVADCCGVAAGGVGDCGAGSGFFGTGTRYPHRKRIAMEMESAISRRFCCISLAARISFGRKPSGPQFTSLDRSRLD